MKNYKVLGIENNTSFDTIYTNLIYLSSSSVKMETLFNQNYTWTSTFDAFNYYNL